MTMERPAFTKMAFTKMEGAGNDYVYVDGFQVEFDIERGGEIARVVADRHFGIGADGLILMAPSSSADLRMVMWNADGSRGTMCGNGIRCLAKLAHDSGVIANGVLVIETDVGPREVALVFGADGDVEGARADMGPVTIASEPGSVEVDGKTYSYHAADVGNPHAVVFVDVHPSTLPVTRIGAVMQESAAFPDGVNVEFVQVVPPATLIQRTYERGSGETMACGSGATAAACAALELGHIAGNLVTVQLLGGDLTITREGSRVVMEGPARTVFSGEISLPIT